MYLIKIAIKERFDPDIKRYEENRINGNMLNPCHIIYWKARGFDYTSIPENWRGCISILILNLL